MVDVLRHGSVLCLCVCVVLLCLYFCKCNTLVVYSQAEQGLLFDCTELHEYSYTFFANMAKVLEEDMGVHVARLAPHLLKEIQASRCFIIQSSGCGTSSSSRCWCGFVCCAIEALVIGVVVEIVFVAAAVAAAVHWSDDD